MSACHEGTNDPFHAATLDISLREIGLQHHGAEGCELLRQVWHYVIIWPGATIHQQHVILATILSLPVVHLHSQKPKDQASFLARRLT